MEYATAIVLAGGRGPRPGETPAAPAPLTPVGGRPFVTHVLDRLVDGGVREVILATGRRGDEVGKAIGRRYADVDVRYSREERPLGTGGAVALALREHNSPDPLWVVSGETYFEADFLALALAHEANTADVTLALAHLDDTGRRARVELSPKRRAGGGLVDAFRDGGGGVGGLVDVGVYLLNPAALQRVDVPETFSLERDFFAKHLEDLRLIGVPQPGPFVDVGVPEDYQRAQALLGGAATR